MSTQNIFYLIERPNDEPKSIDDYRRQNNLMLKIPLLSLGFDGVKLGAWNDGNRELPYIIRGSIVEFLGALYEAKTDIVLVDNFVSTSVERRYIKFVRVGNNLQVLLTTESFPDYNPSLRGFYNGSSEKFLRVSFEYDRGQYVSKNYWDKEDINRYGSNLKGHIVRYEAGRHVIDFPLEVTSVDINISAGGGGGGAYVFNAGGQGRVSTDGSNSEIFIEGRLITRCTAGKRGIKALGSTGHGAGRRGGIATGLGTLYQGKNGSKGTNYNGGDGGTSGTLGGDGGDGLDNGRLIANGGGGGSGAGAWVPITREMLGSSKKIIIVVGGGGLSGRKYDGQQAGAGENGVALLQYFTRVQA